MAKEDGKTAKAELMKILLDDSDDTRSGSASTHVPPVHLDESDDPLRTEIVAARTTVSKPPEPTVRVNVPVEPPTIKGPISNHVEADEVSKATAVAPLRRTTVHSDYRSHDSSNLAQAEHLRIAQDRILELETLVENLRIDNEQLSSAGETLRDRNDELTARLETTETKLKEQSENFDRERTLLEVSVKTKAREVTQLKLKIEELESRLQQDLRKVRVRERELENIIEIVRSEHAAVLTNKDEMILGLKRKVDEMTHQLENQLSQSKEQERLIQNDQDRIKRTVKALRLALSMLEGADSEHHLKKVD